MRARERIALYLQYNSTKNKTSLLKTFNLQDLGGTPLPHNIANKRF